MSQRQLTFFFEEWQQPRYDRADGSDLSELFLYTSAQRAMMDAINELHYLTDGIVLYRTTNTASPGVHPLMIHAMESRERAKRLYRTALRKKISDQTWDLEELFQELECELLRSSSALKVYQRRGSYY